MKILTRDDTEHDVEYVTLADAMAEINALRGCADKNRIALKILQSCGLLGAYYNDIETAAHGVREIIRSLRADLNDPPYDVLCAALRKMGVEGFTKPGVAPTKQLIRLNNANKNQPKQ